MATSTKPNIPEDDFVSDSTLEYEVSQIVEIAHQQKSATGVSSILENNVFNGNPVMNINKKIKILHSVSMKNEILFLNCAFINCALFSND